MGNWTDKPVKVSVEFDGDQITFSLKRLLVEDMLKLMRNYDAGTGSLKYASPLEACAMAKDILPTYVIFVEGMRDGDGHAIDVAGFNRLIGEFYFVPLIGELLGKLIEISTVKGQEKN